MQKQIQIHKMQNVNVKRNKKKKQMPEKQQLKKKIVHKMNIHFPYRLIWIVLLINLWRFFFCGFKQFKSKNKKSQFVMVLTVL